MPSRRNPGIEPGGAPTEGGLAKTATATSSRGAGTGRVGTTVARRFPPVCPSVAEARHFLLEQLGGGCDRDFGLLALMLSELATNAVQHARTEFEVGIWVTPDGEGRSVLVRVTDQAPGLPVPQDPPVDAPRDALRSRGATPATPRASAPRSPSEQMVFAAALCVRLKTS